MSHMSKQKKEATLNMIMNCKRATDPDTSENYRKQIQKELLDAVSEIVKTCEEVKAEDEYVKRNAKKWQRERRALRSKPEIILCRFQWK